MTEANTTTAATPNTIANAFTIANCPECEQFTGARRDWCLGGNGDIERANNWRRGQRLPPLKTYAASQEPGLLTKASNYTRAIAKHVCTGAKTATQAQIDARLAICRGCELFDAVKEICNQCGCGCGNKRAALQNKLAMASQSCPHPNGAKWGPVE